jgi:hypothetical protein
MSDATYQVMLSNYASILEKTNQQLSLWSNPYGIALGILAVLVAILAIGVAVALYLNSRDQRTQTRQFFAKQQKLIDANNIAMDKMMKESEGKLDTLIHAYEEGLKSATTTSKKEIEKAIKELSKEKATIATLYRPSLDGATAMFGTRGSTAAFNPGLSSYIPATSKVITCSNIQCNKLFTVSVENQAPFNSFIGNKLTPCPFCGTLNLC